MPRGLSILQNPTFSIANGFTAGTMILHVPFCLFFVLMVVLWLLYMAQQSRLAATSNALEVDSGGAARRKRRPRTFLIAHGNSSDNLSDSTGGGVACSACFSCFICFIFIVFVSFGAEARMHPCMCVTNLFSSLLFFCTDVVVFFFGVFCFLLSRCYCWRCMRDVAASTRELSSTWSGMP